MTEQQSDKLDFGAMLDAYTSKMTARHQVGEKIKGTVTAIDRNSVFVDIGSKSEGIIDRPELEDDEGTPTVGVGDTIEAFCVSVRDDEVRLTLRMTGSALDASLADAQEAGIPVEGKVIEERKGGYEVLVSGSRAFCPYSQMDLHRHEPQTYLNEKFLFLVTEYDEESRNIILSRRRYLEQERTKALEKYKAELEPGTILTGTVQRVMPFGAFVDIGSGVQGLIPVRELSWDRVERPEDVLTEGQVVSVSIIEANWDDEKITLSLRATQENPWDTIEDRYSVGQRCDGKIVKLMPFGAFVQLEPGVEGLVHISRLGAGRRLRHPEEVVKEGDAVRVVIEGVDTEKGRISLALETGEPEMEAEVPAPAPATGRVEEGAEVRGVVDGIKDFGVFIKLPDGRKGLLHVSQIDVQGSSNRLRALHDKFPPGSEATVVIREIKGDRISLTLRDKLESEAAENEYRQYINRGEPTSLGSLGDAFSKLDL